MAATANQTAKIQAYSTAELAYMYNVGKRTLQRWIENTSDLGEKVGVKWQPKQVRLMFERWGEPEREIIG